MENTFKFYNARKAKLKGKYHVFKSWVRNWKRILQKKIEMPYENITNNA